MSGLPAELQDRSNLRGALVTITVIAALCLWAWSCDYRANRLDRNFDRVTKGMSDREVIALLGEPKSRGRCGEGYYNFVTPISGGGDCLVYASPFAPLNPYYPVVYLDPRGRVIDKNAYASP